MANQSHTFPRETVEFLPLSVLDGTAPVTTYQTAFLPYRVRPTPSDWTPAVSVAGEHGFMVNTPAPGVYGVWVRVLANPESVVISPSDRDGAGFILIT